MARPIVKLRFLRAGAGFFRQGAGQLPADASILFMAAFVIKLLDVLVLTVAGRLVAFEAVGLAFLAESISKVVFSMGDFGLRTVLIRRTARGQLGRATLLRALLLRGGGVLVCLIGATLAIAALAPDLFLALSGFLLAWALFQTHDLGRAVLFGQERFALNAALGVSARVIGAGVAIAGMFGGWGLLGWVLGKLTAETLQLCLVFGFAWRKVPTSVDRAPLPLIREGIPFWSRQTVDLLNGHLEILLVTAYLGLKGAAFFGLAIRVFGAGLLVVGSISAAAFPGLARRREQPIRWRHVWVIGLLAAVMALAVATVGPPAVRWAFPEWTASGDLALRVLAVGLLFVMLHQPATVWLEAHDRELRVLFVNAVSLVCSVAALVSLVPVYGIPGAAAACGLRAIVQAVGAVGYAVLVSRQLRR